LHHMPLNDLDLLFIENVGNLVCPASFDLGHHRNVVLLSVTEGDDKPAKYPVMFRAADLMLISKTDLLPHLDDFSSPRAELNLHNLANDSPVIAFSSKDGMGMDEWIAWLHAELEQYRSLLLKKQTQRPKVQQDGHLLHAQPFKTKFYPVSNKAAHT
jgi:hydrogenase nickel incorporation protein HypB